MMNPIVQLIQLTLRVEREAEGQRRSAIAYGDDPSVDDIMYYAPCGDIISETADQYRPAINCIVRDATHPSRLMLPLIER